MNLSQLSNIRYPQNGDKRRVLDHGNEVVPQRRQYGSNNLWENDKSESTSGRQAQ